MADNANLKDYELALNAVRERTDFVPKVGIVLGSGLGGLADDIEVVTRIPYSELEGFPRSTVARQWKATRESTSSAILIPFR